MSTQPIPPELLSEDGKRVVLKLDINIPEDDGRTLEELEAALADKARQIKEWYAAQS